MKSFESPSWKGKARRVTFTQENGRKRCHRQWFAVATCPWWFLKLFAIVRRWCAHLSIFRDVLDDQKFLTLGVACDMRFLTENGSVIYIDVMSGELRRIEIKTFDCPLSIKIYHLPNKIEILSD
jgi:hypothetical protein